MVLNTSNTECVHVCGCVCVCLSMSSVWQLSQYSEQSLLDSHEGIEGKLLADRRGGSSPSGPV